MFWVTKYQSDLALFHLQRSKQVMLKQVILNQVCWQNHPHHLLFSINALVIF